MQEMLNNKDARNPLNDPDRAHAPIVQRLEVDGYDGSQFMYPYQKNEDFMGHLPHAKATANDLTPLQEDMVRGFID